MNTYMLKIALIGDKHTGKTHFLKTMKGKHPETVNNISCHNSIMTYQHKDKDSDIFNIKLLAPNPHDRQSVNDTINNVDCILYFCSLDNPLTVTSVIVWQRKVHEMKRQQRRKNKNNNNNNNNNKKIIELMVCTSNIYGKDEVIEYVEHTADYLELPVLLYNGTMYSIYNVCEAFINEITDSSYLIDVPRRLYTTDLSGNNNYLKVSFDGDLVYNYIYYPYSSLSARWYEHVMNSEYSESSLCDAEPNELSFASNRRIKIIDRVHEKTSCCSLCWLL